MGLDRGNYTIQAVFSDIINLAGVDYESGELKFSHLYTGLSAVEERSFSLDRPLYPLYPAGPKSGGIVLPHTPQLRRPFSNSFGIYFKNTCKALLCDVKHCFRPIDSRSSQRRYLVTIATMTLAFL